MTYKADVTIIGAGVVGLSIASQVAKTGRKVFVLERNASFGQEQSSRNSEVIHAGVYYTKDSLKAKLCLEGNALLYELCEKIGIAYRKCGKLLVATSEMEAQNLERLFEIGRNNGAPLKMLSRKELARLEPNVRATSSFLSPTTGIIDSHTLMGYFQAQAREKEAQIVYRTEVIDIAKLSDGYEVKVTDPSGISTFKTRVLVNCAGLYSDRMSQMAGIDIQKANYKLHWLKGEYYSVSGGKNKMINRLIYPVPGAVSVGVHVCFDVNWRLRLGPHLYYVNEKSYNVDDSRREGFLVSSMMKALPFIQPSDLEPESSGILAMLQAEGEGLKDFVIRHEKDRGLPGFVNLVGIESPGLTSSPAIGRYVGRMIEGIL
ncbi:MAG: NAD(P)/FAD-dependent oxidoreductase [Dehalococcoidia bacterium]|nr:NAD(P)/FAD-dependent oxidoreductase [Dehalococcoidia bacterium]